MRTTSLLPLGSLLVLLQACVASPGGAGSTTSGSGGSTSPGTGGVLPVPADSGAEITVGSGGTTGVDATVGSGGVSGVDATSDGPTGAADTQGLPEVGGSGGATGSGDTPPARPLNITAAKARYTHRFRTKDADPAVSFNDNEQVAVVDTRSAKMVGKLVLPFSGVGTTNGSLGSPGTFCVPRGFHVLGIAAFQAYDILKNDAAFYGDARKQVFDGIEHTRKYDFANIRMVPSDGVAKRTEMALKYLHRMYPAEDWGYFLNADGTVRWSDVIFTGFSHGASSSPRFAMLVRASRVVSFAGPRDNTCGSFPNCGPNLIYANWMDEVAATPRDRFFTLTGTLDDQHPQHLYAMEKLQYTGKPTLMSVGPPYDGSHRIVVQGGDHAAPCNETNYKAVCNYLFGVAPENANGVP